MFDLLVIWVVTAVSLLIIAQIDFFGVEVENIGAALIGAIVLGLLNGILRPMLSVVAFPLLLLTFGLFSIVINAVVFYLAASLVPGFTLKRGWVSAFLGPVFVSLLNVVILTILR